MQVATVINTHNEMVNQIDNHLLAADELLQGSPNHL